mgnify:FL=1
MKEQKDQEWNLLVPLAPAIALVPLLAVIGVEPIDLGFAAIAAPLAMFPVVLLIGQIWNGNETWVSRFKEGGILALSALSVSLVAGLWMVLDFLGAGEKKAHGDPLTWLDFDVLRHDGTQWNIDAGFTNISFGIWLDPISAMLLFVATFLCFLICWFAIGYMTTDDINSNRNHRFFAEFILFSMGMFGMVLADSFLWLFIFWEIMGLCSYLLIGFYYWKESAAAAAKKAFMTTRVGDVFLMVGLLMLYDIYGSLDFAVVFDNPSTGVGEIPVKASELQPALLMLFIGCVGKSAQFPLHVWLPDAMEGPTPVSALIHAATMVNAGLYLVARMVPFVDVDYYGVMGMEDLGIIIAWVGGITAFMAASIAFVQNDIKKVLAYSTMSQLAYIFLGLGSALYLISTGHRYEGLFVLGGALFHLFNHAMAKGMLFMASGSVIHEMHHAHHELHHHGEHGQHEDHEEHFDAQDMRNMGGLASKMPVTSIAMMLGSMSIIGIPLIGGFWSKEAIIAETWLGALEYEPLLLGPAILAVMTAGMTGFYMSRMWMMTFAGVPKHDVASHVHEETLWIKTPLITLSIVTATTGALLAFFHIGEFLSSKDYSMGLDDLDVTKALQIAFLPEKRALMAVGYVTIALSTFVGPIIAMKVHGGSLKEGQEANVAVSWLVSLSAAFKTIDVSGMANSSLSESLHKRLHFDDLYDWGISKTIAPMARFSAWFDANVIDGIVKLVERTSIQGSHWIRTYTTGSTRDYILMAAVGTLSIFILIVGVTI